jgi:hypothetical protein
MNLFKNLGRLLIPALLAFTLAVGADDKKDEKKPDDKKPDVKKTDDKKPDDKKPDDKKPDDKKPDDKKPDDKKPDDKKPDDKKPEAGTIVIIDSKGKENKLKSWEIVTGTRRLGWLAPPEKEPEEKKPADKGDTDNPPKRAPRPVARGPEALSFRDENSTGYVNGVLTLIPLDTIRQLDYDNEEHKVTVKVAGAKAEDDVTLTGTTKFAGTNKLTIEAEVDKGELGIASVKYLGGVKNGIQGIRFPTPKAAPAPMGKPAMVTILDGKDKKTEKVFDVQALYLTGMGEKSSPILMFKKTVKLDIGKVKKLVLSDDKSGDWTVTLKDGNEETFTLLDTGELDGKQAKLQGLLAKVPAGWKLFPLHCLGEIDFEVAK